MVDQLHKWAKRYISIEGLNSIEHSVKELETKTSAEIVPVIVRSSILGGHAFISVFFAAMALASLIAWDLHTQWFGQSLIIYAIGILTFSIIAALLLSRSMRVAKALLSNTDIEAMCAMRAELEFYRAGVTQTRGRTGVLIFVSLLEHRVVVLADKAISAKLPADTWGHVVQKVVAGLKAGNLAKGMTDGIALCAPLLVRVAPWADGTNELANRPRLKE